MLTAEGIIHCNPDVIIDIRPLLDGDPPRAAAAREEWRAAEGINALRDGRIHVMTADFAVIPGPRFILLVEEMARIIHPELDWGER